MNIQNTGILEPIPGDPNGYISKDKDWAAVPFGKQFIILHKGQQVHLAKNYKDAKSYIQKRINTSKKKSQATLEKLL